ncbi:MAG TPA: dynamin family protein [Bryobacteraceae bacterium]|nr:dynamin family protein [Bryobacteraceae bacterium]
MRGRILRPKQEEYLARLRRYTGDLRSVIAHFGAAPEDEEAVRQSAAQLDALFLIVVVGEFNAGKSALINALLGERVLEEGVTPTTTQIQVVRYGPIVERTFVDTGLITVTAPVDLLREMHIVDTPGTNAIERRHEAITTDFVPRADMVLFLTSADRPLTESERAFLAEIREWGKKVVFVLTKIDILESDEDLNRVMTFVAANVERLLSFIPEIFPVAARPALLAKQSGDHTALARSRFEELERYLVTTLDQEERLRLKLLNPVGVGLRVIDKYAAQADGRLALLKRDNEAIEQMQGELALYREDMRQGFRLRLSDVDNVLHEFERRGSQFFDDAIRMTRIFELVNKAKMKLDFERRVVADAPRQIEQRVGEIIDWLIASDLKQWQAVRSHMLRRKSEHAAALAGDDSGFEYDRTRLIDSVGRAAQKTVEEFDKEAEANRMAESVQVAVAGAALLEAGAVGLGTLVTLLASTTAADVTGILAASMMAVLGLLVIPHRRRSARRELESKVAALREKLMSSLTAQFETEVERTVRRADDALAPYTRFIRAEQEKITRAAGELNRLKRELTRLRTEIG